jgi:hypothetical protein
MDEHSLEAGGEAMHDIEDALADAFVGAPPPPATSEGALPRHGVPPPPPSCNDQHPCQQTPRASAGLTYGHRLRARAAWAGAVHLCFQPAAAWSHSGRAGDLWGCHGCREPSSRPSTVCRLAGRTQLVAGCSFLGPCPCMHGSVGGSWEQRRASSALHVLLSFLVAAHQLQQFRGLGSRGRAAAQQRQGSCPLSYKAVTTLQAAGTAFATAERWGRAMESPCGSTLVLLSHLAAACQQAASAAAAAASGSKRQRRQRQ